MAESGGKLSKVAPVPRQEERTPAAWLAEKHGRRSAGNAALVVQRLPTAAWDKAASTITAKHPAAIATASRAAVLICFVQVIWREERHTGQLMPQHGV